MTDSGAAPLSDARIDALLAFAQASSDQSETTQAPFTGAAICELTYSSIDDVQAAADRAGTAGQRWAQVPARDRAALALRLHDIVLAGRSEILDIVQWEAGKARTQAFEEVADAANLARHLGRRAPGYLRAQRRPGLVPVLTSVRVHRRPVGLAAVITPWNYPLSLVVADVLPALLAGNGVLLRPDSQGALTALWVAEALHKAGLPPDVLQVLIGPGSTVGTALIDQADHVTFTGSSATGATVGKQAAGRLIGACLELGGKNAFYVADDSDLDAAAEAAVRASFASAGQLCLSFERLILHTAIAEPFLRHFLARVRSLRIGIGYDYTADVGSLVSRAQVDKMQSHIDDAVAHGARVVEGGVPRTDIGPLCFAPTVLADVPKDAAVYREETFGPLVSVYTVASDEEALAMINDTDYGLNCAIWTADGARARAMAAQVRTGMVNINEGYAAAWGSVAAPVGGMKNSGLGRRHGREGLWEYTELQTVARQVGAQAGFGLGKLYGLEGQTWTRLTVQGLRLMKALRRRA